MNARISLNGKIVKNFFGAVKGTFSYQSRIRLHITTSGSLWYRTIDYLHHNLIFAIISKFEKFDKPEKPFTLVLDINDLHYLLDLINDDEIIEISLNSDKPSEIRSELFLLELERLPDTSIKKDPNKFEMILNNGAMINVDKLKNVLRILDYTVIQLASDTGKCIVRSSLENCMSSDSMCPDGSIYWKDNDCGYKEVTTHKERYDYSIHKFIQQDQKVLRFTKPRLPLPSHQQPEYLWKGIVMPSDIPQGQMTFEETLTNVVAEEEKSCS